MPHGVTGNDEPNKERRTAKAVEADAGPAGGTVKRYQREGTHAIHASPSRACHHAHAGPEFLPAIRPGHRPGRVCVWTPVVPSGHIAAAGAVVFAAIGEID
ncbi:hypothetical protein SEVIR_7G091350v4 [Setaria viridis]